MQQNIEKNFLVLEINIFELVAYYGENTWHQQSTESAVNGLRSSLGISDLTKVVVFKLYLSENDEKFE